MNDEFQSLIDGYLDDCLSPEETLRLNSLLKGNLEFSRRFARAMMLHDRLHAELQADALADADGVVARPTSPASLSFKRWTMTAAAAIAALLLVGIFLWQGGSVAPASAAMVALDRLIEVASQPTDRVYRIRVTDHGPNGPAPVVQSGGGGKKPGVDGATLYVRGSDKFVLVRQFGNGAQFITGSDGELGWAVAPKGHVHLSKDTRRFRRAVPGEHEEIPFADLQTGLSELRRAYQLKLAAADDADPALHGRSRLDAMKRPGRGGPEEVHIWFDAAGVAHRIELVGMPQEQGSPRGVALELIEQRDIGPDFFKHETHHAADRPVDWE